MSTRSSNLAALQARQGRPSSVTFIPEPEPEELFAPIVSVDDHVLEPPDLFEGRLSPEQAPHVDMGDDGAPRWVVDGKRLRK